LERTVSGFQRSSQRGDVFVVARNSEYEALKKFTRLMHAPDTPSLESSRQHPQRRAAGLSALATPLCLP
jgi:hypothetical protein